MSELTRVTKQSQPRISQHLKQLCSADLLERFRDGHFVYYRVPLDSEHAAERRRLFALLPVHEPQFEVDFESLCTLRAEQGLPVPGLDDDSVRRLHRALIELTVSAPLGDLLDIGSGRGKILKLLGSRAQRARRCRYRCRRSTNSQGGVAGRRCRKLQLAKRRHVRPAVCRR